MNVQENSKLVFLHCQFTNREVSCRGLQRERHKAKKQRELKGTGACQYRGMLFFSVFHQTLRKKKYER